MKCGSNLEEEVGLMLLQCRDTSRRHYHDANAPQNSALAFLAYQK